LNVARARRAALRFLSGREATADGRICSKVGGIIDRFADAGCAREEDREYDVVVRHRILRNESPLIDANEIAIPTAQTVLMIELRNVDPLAIEVAAVTVSPARLETLSVTAELRRAEDVRARLINSGGFNTIRPLGVSTNESAIKIIEQEASKALHVVVAVAGGPHVEIGTHERRF